MGNCGSDNKVEDIAPERNEGKDEPGTFRRPASAAPDQQLAAPEITEDGDSDYGIIRILLLGAAESGKTTLLEQSKLFYGQPWSEAELFHRKSFIYNNILKNIKILITRMKEKIGEFNNPANEELAMQILDCDDEQYACFTNDICYAIKQVWADRSIQDIYDRRSEVNLNDSTRYFLDNISLINRLDYTPTPRDLIMSYCPTVGVQNVIITANKKAFQLFDIGGQRIDRRKWATMYDGINAIFFCLAISEYDQTMMEDLITNRLTDSLSLLTTICEEKKFTDIPIFLFLNEVDVFREKLKVIPLKKFQPDFSGSTVEEALDFVEQLAIDATKAHNPDLVYIHRICAIDSNAISRTLESVFKALMKRK